MQKTDLARLQTIIGAVKGRPPVAGDRYPCGKRKGVQSHEVPGSETRRMLDMVRDKVLDPKLGEPIGRMCYCKEISVAEYDAARKFTDRKLAHDRAIEAPSSTARSPVFQTGRGGVNQPEPTDAQVRAVHKAIDRHQADRHAILDHHGGAGMLEVLNRVCIEQREPSWSDKRMLHDGLEALMAHYSHNAGKRA